MTDAGLPWDRDVVGVELLLMQPVIARVLGLERRPDVRWPAPIEGSIGHVALRLVDDGPVRDQWVVGVSAYMDVDGDGVDEPSNALRGIFGGYDQRLEVRRLEEFGGDYASDQARWIERYALPMTRAEIEALVLALRQAWVASEAHALGAYAFFGENCSTELTALLDQALLGRPRELNYPYTLPRKYTRRGFLTPSLGRVTPADAATGAFEMVWAAPALGVLCADGDDACVRAWADAAAGLGQEWTADMARRLERRRYRDRFAPGLLPALRQIPTSTNELASAIGQ